ncbi:hypothetical protein LTS10_003847 [Elasticomyces elasticus]|nr:hypothetical protein LTS10_003847 [Elasticomyces elasticus]
MVQTRQMAKLAAMAPRDLSKLPNEILTMVLSYLSTEEIVRAKEISRQFSNVIFDFDSTLFRPHAQAAVQKLVDASSRVMQTDGKPRTFYQQLAIFFSHRGIQTRRKLRMYDLNAFTRQWQKVHDPLPGQSDSRLHIFVYAEVLVDMHVHFHGRSDVKENYERSTVPRDYSDLTGFAADIRLAAPWSARRPYTDKDQKLKSIFHLIRETGLVDMETGSIPKLVHDSRDSGAHLPEYPLTQLEGKLVDGEFKGMRDGKRRRQAGRCSQHRLQIILGRLGESLPTLPHTRRFTYCVPDRDTYCAFLSAKKAFREGIETSWQFRARLIERMFLY